MTEFKVWREVPCETCEGRGEDGEPSDGIEPDRVWRCASCEGKGINVNESLGSSIVCKAENITEAALDYLEYVGASDDMDSVDAYEGSILCMSAPTSPEVVTKVRVHSVLSWIVEEC